jgi:hypothetical protein
MTSFLRGNDDRLEARMVVASVRQSSSSIENNSLLNGLSSSLDSKLLSPAEVGDDFDFAMVNHKEKKDNL